MAKRLDNLEENFLKTINENNLISRGDVIVVGVSGGPDSITLLTCLNKYKEKLGCKIIVAHINHLIRKDSTDDEQFVESTCKNLGIKFYTRRVEIEKLAKATKKGTEEVGREIRYNFFDEIAEKECANKIAIAHNMNDNAETMILNLIRGSGTIGMEGIQPQEYNKYIRPLINCNRLEIEEYCKKNNLQPRIDSTNKENIYKRNIIRNKIIPELKELNPNIIETLSRTSKIVKAENDYISKITDEFFLKLANIKINQESLNSVKEISFAIRDFNVQSEIIKENLILKAIGKINGSTRNIEKINVDDIIKMAKNNIGNKYIILNKTIKIIIKDKKIFLIRL